MDHTETKIEMIPEKKGHMNQHTPGPWEAERVTRTNRFGIWRAGIRLATLEKRSIGYEHEEKANARLIAKAPEMYEFLKHLDNLWALQAGSKASLDDDRAKVRAVLREIEGGRDE